MGGFLRDVMKLNMEARNFRLFSPDENNSNRWKDVFEATNRAWVAEAYPFDDHLAPDGRVMEMLSEHQCQGWLAGTASSRATRRSSTSSMRCSTSLWTTKPPACQSRGLVTRPRRAGRGESHAHGRRPVPTVERLSCWPGKA